MNSLLDKQPATLPTDETLNTLFNKINDWDKAKIVERFLTNALPHADTSILTAFRSTLDQALPYQNYFEVMLRTLLTPEKFCGRMLKNELLKKHGNGFMIHDTMNLTPATAAETAPNTLSLLHAAMLNFTDTESAQGYFSPDNKTVIDVEDSPVDFSDQTSMTAHEFAALSRTLDLGGEYQKYLSGTLAVSSVELNAVRLGKLNMRLVAYEKSLNKPVRAEILPTLVDLSKGENDIFHGTTFNDSPVQLMSVKLFGKYAIHAVLIVCQLTEKDKDAATADTYILYIPNDPGLGFYDAPDEDNMRIKLASQIIATPSLRSAIASQLNNVDQEDFLKKTQETLPFTDEIAFTPLDKGMFSYLFGHRLNKLLSDVREVALPVANVNDPVYAKRRENLTRYKRPPLSASLIYDFSRHWRSNAADALLSNVFTGLEDWTCMEKHTALCQLLELKQPLASSGIQRPNPGAAAQSAGEYFKAFEVREHAHLQQGYRLWKRALSGYEVAAHIANRVTDYGHSDDEDRRVLNFNGRHYIKIDETVYEVEANPLAWRIRHPLNRDSYWPPVVYSPSAGWSLQNKQAVIVRK